jgi:hypothetical protein
MRASTMKTAFLGIMMASILPFAACSDDSDTPTSPTQPGPPVSTPAPDPPAPPPPTPTPTPEPPPTPPPSDGTTVTVSGVISNFSRFGEGDMNVRFRINDFLMVEADANTAVREGSMDSNTTSLRLGQAVTVTGSQTNGTVHASRIVIDSQ